MRDYAAFTTLITTKLQSAGTMDYSVSEVNYQIEECLKEFAQYRPHLHPVIFKIESRFGIASTTSTDNLVDSTKGQFLSTDPGDEKVIYNATDHTWAVVLSYADTTSVGISRDIFAVNEEYRVYNKRCWNSKQINIGDMVDWEKIDSVEYPIGEKRNWKIYDNDILELNVDYVQDSDASSIKASTSKPDVDVLVRFARPHVLSQLTDWVGKFAASAAAGATTLSGSSLQSAGTIEVGEEFYVENHKTLYIVTAETTISSNTAAISFYPPLEAAVAATTWTFTFTKSSLRPNDEDIFADLVASRLAINKSPKYFNTIAIGNPNAWRNYHDWGQGRLIQTLNKLQGQTKPKVNHTYTTE
jgi:hypothetical protein